MYNEGTEKIVSSGMKISVARTTISALTNHEGDYELVDVPFGSQVFVKAYGESFWGISYEDLDLSKLVFPNLNEDSSEPLAFTVP